MCGEDYFLTEQEKNNKVSGKFLYAITDFSIFKKEESYWLEYIGNDTYLGRSDNILNQEIKITPFQLSQYFSEKPLSAFENYLALWFYNVRTWGLLNGESNEDFCNRNAHKAVKILMEYISTDELINCLQKRGGFIGNITELN